jgi:thiamine biosynthesis lipoprotein
MVVPAIFVGALFVALVVRRPAPVEPRGEWAFEGRAMGTVFSVKVVPPADADLTEAEVASAVGAAITDVDHRMSTYRGDSELSRFNRHGAEPFAASPELVEVMAEAQRVSALSGGAFDITVGPLVDVWGFGPTPVAAPPGEDEISRLLAATGFGRLEVDTATGSLRKADAALRCDLSAIAKGYAVDRAAEALAGLGATGYMVEIGGEVRAAGRTGDGAVWRIGIERPQLERGGVWGVVELTDTALATSGDYRNYYERDGVRISHTIDPRTGRPITHALASVTVVHPSCMTADALATALNVLGPEAGPDLAAREGIAALFLVREPGGAFVERASPAWPSGKVGPGGGVAPDEAE